MKKVFLIILASLISVLLFNPSVLAKSADESKLKVMESYGKLPLYFIKNEGQLDEKVKYYERNLGHSTYFTEEGIYFVLGKKEEGSEVKSSTVNYVLIKFEGADKAELLAEERLKGRVNYFIGNDPERWRTDVPTYGKVRYSNLYQGIDLVFYGNQRQLEYDIVVKPGANPEYIKFRVEGAKEVKATEDGGIEIVLSDGLSILQKIPHVYQEIEGRKVEILAGFKVTKDEEGYSYSLTIGEYNKEHTLIIDPLVLSYSTYLGGSNHDNGYGIAVDASGNAYVTGYTESWDFPTKNAYQGYQGGDVFVTKLNATGNDLIYSTYLGGSDWDAGYGIAVDALGNAYVTGTTSSTDFPTKNAYQNSKKGLTDAIDAFVTKLNSNGNDLIYSTYLGGYVSDWGLGIAVDASGNAYVTGITDSDDFPTKNPYQSDKKNYYEDVFVTKLNSAGNDLIYSTYLGGSGNDVGRGIAVDASGNAYVTGETWSTDFPTKNAYQDSYKGWSDVFVTKLNPAGNDLIYSTYLGGSDRDDGRGIAVDASGNAYVTGETWSTDFPTKNAYQGDQDSQDAFVTKIDTTKSGTDSLIYSTYLGGSDRDDGRSIAVDASGNAYVTGTTYSTDFPTKNAYQGYQGGGDVFVTKLNPTGNDLIYSTYLGGRDGNSGDHGYCIAVDATGNAYVTGYTSSTDFPTKNAYQGSYKGWEDVFVTKLSFELLKVLKPNGGEKWNAGSKYIVRWEAPLNSYKFNLRYSTDNKTTWTNIATVLASNRCKSDGTKYTCTYGWIIPAQDGRKPQSFVRVRAFNSSNQVIGTDDSDKAFVIEVLKLTSPNGGETLTVGSTNTITWQTYALTKTVARVQLQYSTNNGQTWTNIVTLTGNPGQYNWTVPNVSSSSCRVKVMLRDSEGAIIASDTSDRVFTIQQ